MKTTVRNSVLTCLLLAISILAQSQPDPAVESATISASPALWPNVVPEDYETITFQVKNYGLATNASEIKIAISLSALNFDQTFDPAIHITKITGNTLFNFAYAPATKVLTGTLANSFATGDAGLTTFRINKLVVQQKSPYPQAVIGANLNIVTFGTFNQTTANDNKSIYTYTSPKISGNIFDDANGNAVKDADESFVTDMWVNLVTADGIVLNSVKVGPSGDYLFNIINYNTNYKVILTTTNQIGNNNLATAILPDGYVSTGVNLSSTPNVSNKNSAISLSTAELNFVNQNFGIEQTPTAVPLEANYSMISVNVKYVLSPSATIPQPALAGTDPEQTNLGSGSTFIITKLPLDAKLFYDGVEITATDVTNGTGTARITNYDPNKLAFSFNYISVSSTVFEYKVEDAAGIKSPATTYNISASSLLPVTGLQLKGSLIDNVPHLTWSTLTEQNTSHFEIAKSYDGINFTTSATVKAVGNSNSLATYSYAYDAISENKMVYYRITLVDLNGKKTASNIIHLSINSFNITLFPNPATGYVTVNGLPAGAELMLTDVKGGLVQKYKATTSNIKINLSGMASGTYMVQVQQKGEIISNKKFIKK